MQVAQSAGLIWLFPVTFVSSAFVSTARCARSPSGTRCRPPRQQRSDSRAGFVPIAKRWIVEQTNGTLMLHRRLVREYEIREASSESRTWWASTANMVRRLSGTATLSWRGR